VAEISVNCYNNIATLQIPRTKLQISKRVIKKFFNNQTAAFFVFLLVIAVLLIIFNPGSFAPSPSAKLGSLVKCSAEKFSPSLLERTVGDGADLLLLVNLKAKPSADEISAFAGQGITLYPDSWVLDYLVAETDYKNLCKLAKNDSVTFIDITGS